MTTPDCFTDLIADDVAHRQRRDDADALCEGKASLGEDAGREGEGSKSAPTDRLLELFKKVAVDLKNGLRLNTQSFRLKKRY